MGRLLKKVETALHLADEIDAPHFQHMSNFAVAHVYHVQNNPGRANIHLARGLQIARSMRSFHFQFQGLLLEALFALDRREKKSRTSGTQKRHGIG